MVGDSRQRDVMFELLCVGADDILHGSWDDDSTSAPYSTFYLVSLIVTRWAMLSCMSLCYNEIISRFMEFTLWHSQFHEFTIQFIACQLFHSYYSSGLIMATRKMQLQKLAFSDYYVQYEIRGYKMHPSSGSDSNWSIHLVRQELDNYFSTYMFVIAFSVMLVTAKKSRWISHDAMRSDIYLTKLY